jgi:hypothetical protein
VALTMLVSTWRPWSRTPDEACGGLVTDDTVERERRMIDESRFEE